MNLAGIFKIFKKAGKKGAAASKKDKGGEVSWPPGTRIGVYGHSNSGKTVYFTVLNEDCKVSKKLQISVTDSPTAGEFLTNYRSIWGRGATSDVGTMVDLKGEKKFPPPTASDKILQFTAILDRTKRMPIVTYDYNGKAVSISDHHDLKDKVLSFMHECDGILFFFDPKALAAELQCQAHVASFVNLIEQIAPGGGRLPVPIGLVITKADILPGFKDQTMLISPEEEHILADDYEIFLERVLSSDRVSGDPKWAGTVRDILVKLKPLLTEVVGRTLDFQIFFTSCTGKEPEKIGTDVGRSIYKPPDKMTPIGVREPFYWLLKAVVQNSRFSLMRTVTKWVAILSILFAVVWSIPFAWHFWYQFPDAMRTEDKILGEDATSLPRPGELSEDQIKQIRRPFYQYRDGFLVKRMFKDFEIVARDRVEYYDRIMNANIDDAMDNVIARFSSIVSDTTSWPKKAVGDTALVENPQRDQFLEIQANLEDMNIIDESSKIFRRRERVLWFWTNFRQAIVSPATDTMSWRMMAEKVDEFRDQGVPLSSQERNLYSNIESTSERYLAKEEEKKEVVNVGAEIRNFVSNINNNNSARFRLIDAPRRLSGALGKLQSDPASADLVEGINTYLSEVKAFQRDRRYVYWLSECPPDHHVHVKVDKRNNPGQWRVNKQIWPVVIKDTLVWQMGDDIIVALDEEHKPATNPETWGEKSALKRELKGRLSVFEMTQPLSFGDKTIRFQFEQDLTEMLPKFPQ